MLPIRWYSSAKMAAILRKSPILNSFNSIPNPKLHLRPNPTSTLFNRKIHSKIQFPRFYNELGDMSRLGFGVVGRKESGSGLDFVRVGAVSDAGGGGSGGDGGGGFGGRSGGGGGGDEGGDNGSSIFSWYFMALDKYPVATKAITSAFLTLIGDLICQFVIDQVTKLDLKRTFVFTFLGLVLVGPTLHFWYLSLSKLVTIPGASGAFLRLLLDQFLFSPIFIGVFLCSLVTLEGRPSQVIPKLQQEWFSSVLANWQLWIPFQFLNFLLVPQKFQVLAANVVALAWNVILSFKAHKEVVIK